MERRVFYHLTQDELEVSSAAPVEMEIDDLIDSLLGRLEHEDDYVGLIDEAENLLQVMRDAESRLYRVEFPVPDERHSFTRVMGWSEVTDFLQRLPPLLEPHRFPDFRVLPW